MTFLNQHFQFCQSHKNFLEKILLPLKKITDVQYIFVQRYFKNGKSIYLSNNLDWTKVRFSKTRWTSHYLSQQVESAFISGNVFFYVKDDPPNDDALWLAAYAADCWNGVLTYNISQNYFDIISFFGNREHRNIPQRLHQQDFLLRSYLREISPIINDMLLRERETPLLLESFWPKKSQKIELMDTFAKDIQSSLTSPKKQILSQRQKQVLQALAEGLSQKEIADRLYISQRTVENHISDIKSATNCYHRSALCHFYRNHIAIF